VKGILAELATLKERTVRAIDDIHLPSVRSKINELLEEEERDNVIEDSKERELPDDWMEFMAAVHRFAQKIYLGVHARFAATYGVASCSLAGMAQKEQFLLAQRAFLVDSEFPALPKAPQLGDDVLLVREMEEAVVDAKILLDDYVGVKKNG
jgi:exopolyphosphatase/pppGpp-phosphohydrolase